MPIHMIHLGASRFAVLFDGQITTARMAIEQSVLIPTKVCKAEDMGALGIATSPGKLPVRTPSLDLLSMQGFRYTRCVKNNFLTLKPPNLHDPCH